MNFSPTEIISLSKVAAGIYANRIFTGPFTVQLGLSDACNLKCIMCNIFSPLRDENSYLPNSIHKILAHDTVVKLIEDLGTMGTKKINLVGFGETLIYPNLMEVIQLIKSYKIKVYITTNGLLLSKKMVDGFFELGLDGLYVSLNAATTRTYREIHIGADSDGFNNILENMRYLKERRNCLKRQTPNLCLSFVIMSSNYHEVREMIALAKDVGADRLIFRDVGIYSDKCGFLRLGEKHIKYVKEQISSFKGEVSQNNFLEFLQALEGINKKQKMINCYAGYVGGALITADGSVFPCCNCNKSMGNIYDERFKKIWKSKSYDMFRQEGQNIIKRNRFPSNCSCIQCPTYHINNFIHRKLFFWKKNI